MIRPRLPRGVVPVLMTVFADNGEVDLEAVQYLLRHVTSQPVAGVMFPGFASEFLKISAKERDELETLFLAHMATQPHASAIVGVTDHCTELAISTAQSAASRGADLLNLLPPFAMAPNAASVREHIEEVLAAVPDTPVLVQLAPALTGESISTTALHDIARRHRNFAGVKVETLPPGPLISSLVHGSPRLDTYVGYAGLFLSSAVSRGAVGVQPSTGFVEIYIELWRLIDQGDQIAFRTLQDRLTHYLLPWMQDIEIMIQVEKTIALRRGLIGSDMCRRPHRTLDASIASEIEGFLTEFSSYLTQGKLRGGRTNHAEPRDHSLSRPATGRTRPTRSPSYTDAPLDNETPRFRDTVR